MDNKLKPTPLSGRIWFSAIFFGLVGQIAWIVENMYFATFAQDIFANSGRSDLSYTVTTLMVIFSAIAATLTTIFAGGLCDRLGKRKPFIAYGYIVWGLTIMVFGFIPMKVAADSAVLIGALLVIFDCIMTFAGSTSNDAAFNTWITDVTDTTNRGKVNAFLSILPVIAVVIVFVGLGGFYSKTSDSNLSFFLILGAIPIVAGIIAIFVLKDKGGIAPNRESSYLQEAFYGFKGEVIKQNRMMYICLAAACIVGIAQQTFFSYLINFVQLTLGFGEGIGFIIVMAVVILGAAVVTAIMGVLYDKFGRKHFYFPLLCGVILGCMSFYLLDYVSGALFAVLVYGGGVVMMGSILSLTGALMATFQDNIPQGCEGRFQGVRMCFTVLIPMIIGPIISLIIGLDAMGMNGEGFMPPYAIFLAAAIVALLAFIPISKVRKASK